MEEVKYITVKEFAQRAGISRQTIYKTYSNPNSRLYPYVKVLPKGIYISTQALIDLYNNPCNEEQVTIEELEQLKAKETKETDIQKQTEQPYVDTFEHSIYNDFVSYLKNEINQKQEQIDKLNNIIQEKDRIIIEQAGQIISLTTLSQSMVEVSNKALTATTNQQTLSAMEKQPMLDSQDNVAQPRKGIIKRLFGGR